MSKKEELSEKLIKKEEETEYLHSKGILYNLFIGHTNKIIKKGDESHFTLDMLYKMEDKYNSKNTSHFLEYYEKRKEKYKNDFYHLSVRYPRDQFYYSLILQIIK